MANNIRPDSVLIKTLNITGDANGNITINNLDISAVTIDGEAIIYDESLPYEIKKHITDEIKEIVTRFLRYNALTD